MAAAAQAAQNPAYGPHGHFSARPGARAPEVALRRLLAIVLLVLVGALIAILLVSRGREPDVPLVEDPPAATASAPAPAPLEAPVPALAERPAPRGALPAATPAADRELVVVVRTATGKPVPDARVFVEDTDPVGRGWGTDGEGRAVLRTSSPAGWVLARTQGSVWGREAFGSADEVTVTVSEDRVLWGTVRDPWGRPAKGVHLRVSGDGHENPGRAWPGVRRWEMRSEETEVVTDSLGRFEVLGLASEGFWLSVEVRGLAGEGSWLSLARDAGESSETSRRRLLLPGAVRVRARSGALDLVVSRPVEAFLRVVDDVSGEPVRSPSAVPLRFDVAPTGAVRAEPAPGGLVLRWPESPQREAIRLRVRLSAPGYEPTEVAVLGTEPKAGEGTAAVTPFSQEVRLRRDARNGSRASAILVRMPPDVRSPVAVVQVAFSHTRGGRGFRTDRDAVNRGDHWEIEVAEGGGRASVSPLLGLEIPDWLALADGEAAEVVASPAPWGSVALRLAADADLCRGWFEAEAQPTAGPAHRFRVWADAKGRAEAGWWPAGSWTFRVFRSAEEGTSEVASVRPGPEPTVVEIPVRNLLRR